MAQLFISHEKSDGSLALELSADLKRRGFTTWCYEEDSVPGLSYLLQTGSAIKEAAAMILIISKSSLKSSQVTAEVIRAHEESKPFVPVLNGMTHIEFQTHQHEWREALGAATSVSVPPEGVGRISNRIVQGINALGIFAETASSPKTAPFAEAQPAAAEKIRIVLIDDQPMVTEAIEYQLRLKRPYEVKCAADGLTGCQLIEAFNPKLVITDLKMPRMDGLEMMRKVRGNPKIGPTAFAFASAYLSAELFNSFKEIDGCVRFISKPYSFDKLLALIDELLAELEKSPQTKQAPPPLPPRAAARAPESAPTAGADDIQNLADCKCIFTDACKHNIATLDLTEEAVLELVQGEFRSHSNYFLYDLENYPLPLRSSYIILINKTGKRLEFTGLIRCSADQAKLASWSDILALYRRATRLAYRSDPVKIFFIRGALDRAAALHLDLRTRIAKHFTKFEGLPIDLRLAFLDSSAFPGVDSARNAMADEIAFHLRESARADEEAVQIDNAVSAEDMTVAAATGPAVLELERSLQHIHKVITAFPPIA